MSRRLGLPFADAPRQAMAFTVCLCFLVPTCFLSLLTLPIGGSLTAVWFPAAAATGLALYLPGMRIRHVLGALAVTVFAGSMIAGIPPFNAICLTLVNAIEVSLSITLLREPFVSGTLRLTVPRTVIFVTINDIVLPAFCGAIYALAAGPVDHMGAIVGVWTISHLIGSQLVIPVVATLPSWARAKNLRFDSGIRATDIKIAVVKGGLVVGVVAVMATVVVGHVGYPLSVFALILLLAASVLNVAEISLLSVLVLYLSLWRLLIGFAQAHSIGETGQIGVPLALAITAGNFLVMAKDGFEGSRRRYVNSMRQMFSTIREAALGIVMTDPQGRISYANIEANRVLGYEAGAIDNLEFDHFIPDKFKPDTHRHFQSVNEGAVQHARFESALIARNGAIIPVMFAVSQLRQVELTNGDTHLLVIQMVDLTERHAAEQAVRESSDRLQLATEAGQVGVWDRALATGETFWNQWMYHILGIAPGDKPMAAHDLIAYLHPQDRLRAAQSLQTAVATCGAVDEEFRFVRASGEIRQVRVLGRILADADGHPERSVGGLWDFTDQQRLVQKVLFEQDRLRTILESIGDAVVVVDSTGNVTFINAVGEALSGWNAADAVGCPVTEVLQAIDERTQVAVSMSIPINAARLHGNVVALEDGAALVRRDGTVTAVAGCVAPLRSRDDAISGVVLIFEDVTQKRRLQQELYHAANHDHLTGLPNRRHFMRHLETMHATVEERPFVVGYFDLDRFKLINDTAGHLAGDSALIEITRILGMALGPDAFLARIGGDEFGVIFDNHCVSAIEAVCQRLITIVRGTPFSWGGKTFNLGLSIGLVEGFDAANDPATLLKHADIACFSAKSGGRNRVSIYNAGNDEVSHYQRSINAIAGLHRVISENRLTLHAQEIHAIRVEKGVALREFEVLVRMIGEDGSLIAPGAFIPAAERYDLMASIDRWVLRELFEQHGQLLRDHPLTKFTVNLSANSLGDDNFWQFVRELMLANDIPPERITLEITETAAMKNIVAGAGFVRQARKVGVGIAIDDFGIGFGSFVYLKDFEASMIKIDASFVQDAPDSQRSLQLIQAIVDIADRLGMQTVAEGVETRAMCDLVEQAGVGKGQGFFWSRPMPIEEAVRATVN